MEILSDHIYVSTSPIKTSKMHVSEYDSNSNVIVKFVTIEGFQLDRYLANVIWPTCLIKWAVDPDDKIIIKVYDRKNLMRKYVGIYQS